MREPSTSYSTRATLLTPRRSPLAGACMAGGAILLLWSFSSSLARNKSSGALSSTTQSASETPDGKPVEALAALPADAAESSTALRKANRIEQAQVQALYEGWKRAWELQDIDKCMSFYAPNTTLRTTDGMLLNRDQTRDWLRNLLGSRKYFIASKPLAMYSDGQRVAFTAVELYKDHPTSPKGQTFDDRYVWQKQPLQRGSQKHAWLIVEQAYLDSEVSAR